METSLAAIFVLPDIHVMLDFFIRLFFNYLTVFVVARFIFYPNNGQKEMIFTFVILGLVVFLISSALSRLSIEFGFALGLFAVFSVIRYRTIPVESKELTYLAAVIGISVINALVESKNSEWMAFIIADFILVISVYIFEKYNPGKTIGKKQLIATLPDIGIVNDHQLLQEELVRQTSLPIFKTEVSKINATKKEVTVWIYYR